MLDRRDFLLRSGGLLAALGASCPVAADDCLGATIGDASLKRFLGSLDGTCVLPADPSYPAARLLYNLRFDSRPSLIVRPSSIDDIRRTVDFARDASVHLAIRSGGHSYIGASGSEGIVLDLSSMGGVQPLGGSMFRIAGGTQLQRVYGDLRCNGNWTLPCGSCDTVGFGGIAQGGGFGYLQRAHGLTCDRVRAATVVLADGSVVQAAPEADGDLLWALRGGGGGSFGVAVDFTVEAVPFAPLQVILWYWPLDAADEALALMHDAAADGRLPRHASAGVIFNRPAAALATPQCIGLLWSRSSMADAMAARSMLTGPGGIPATPGLGYSYQADSPACDPTAVATREHYRAKSSMVYGAPTPGTGAAIRSWMLARVASPVLSAADYATINFLTLGGAVSDLAPDATAFPHRDARLEVQYLAYVQSPNPRSIEANRAWIRGAYADVAPRLANGGSGGYCNYADEDLTAAQYPAHYWGANYPRLQATKRRVDPGGFFRGKQTVRG